MPTLIYTPNLVPRRAQLLLRALVPFVLIGASVTFQYCRGTPQKALPFALWLTFLVYSLVASPAFQAFNCEAFDHGDGNVTSYLRADYSVVCAHWTETTNSDGTKTMSDFERTGDYSALTVLAALVIIVYPLGVPLLYALLFIGIRRHYSLRMYLKFLTDNYKQSFFYWELISTLQKLLLASFFALPMFGHGTLMQILSALVAQLVFLILQVHSSNNRANPD